MATATLNLGRSGENYKTGSGVILGASRGAKYITAFNLYWGINESATGAYLYNYGGYKNGAIYFYINGTHVASATYDGRNARPSVSWSGNITIPPQTAITISFSSSDTSSSRAMRNEFHMKITYTVQAHPTVSAGGIIYNSQIQALNYYINGNNTGPGVGNPIKPYVIGTTDSIIYASTYNNA